MNLIIVYISIALLSGISCNTDTETKNINAIRKLAREVLLLRRIVADLQKQQLQRQTNPSTFNHTEDISTLGPSVEKRGRCINGCLQRGGLSFIRCKAMCRRRR